MLHDAQRKRPSTSLVCRLRINKILQELARSLKELLAGSDTAEDRQRSSILSDSLAAVCRSEGLHEAATVARAISRRIGDSGTGSSEQEAWVRRRLSALLERLGRILTEHLTGAEDLGRTGTPGLTRRVPTEDARGGVASPNPYHGRIPPLGLCAPMGMDCAEVAGGLLLHPNEGPS